jgi:PAS domain S-box-containing protein
MFSTTQKRLSRRKVQITIFGSMSLVCMIVTAFLAVQVFVKLDHYGSTPIDNIQWTMSQLEVEQIKLATALERLEDPTEDTITHARQRFDILYSRANAMKNGSGYRAALNGSAADQQLDIIFSELTGMLPFFDTSDAALIAERATLLDATNALTPAIRRLSSEAISIGAKAAQAERTSLTSTLQKMALMSLLMVTAMLSLMWLLWRLYTLYRHRAFQNRITLNRLSTILDTSEDAILVVRPDGTIIETNTAARSLFGSDNTETGKSNIYGVLYREEDDGTLTAITDEPLGDVRAGEADPAPLVARRQDGSLAAVELSANVAARSGDEVWVCFIRDISDRLAAEAEVQAARDKALSNEKAKAHFLGRISHEMRTPLHGILGTLDLMDSTPLSPEQTRYSDIMKSSGQVLLNQINDALDITRSSAEPLPLVETVFDVEQLIEDIATSQGAVAEAHGNTIDLHVQNAPVGTVLGDRDRVQQVLLNLVSNAIKFTRNGHITIEAARVGLHGRHDNIVEIQVSDTGIGIAEDDVERIFDDFVRVISSDGERTEGTGLGLGIARNLVLQMGGDIGVESLLGEGSVFWVRLPLRAARIEQEAALKDTSKTVSQSIAPMDILIIEDNPTNRFVLKVMLEKQGHRVSLAVDGETGVALSRVRSFDLVVVDVNMPGIDGGEATQRIRSGNGASARTRIVALSAYIDVNTRETLMKSGVDDVHIKPLRMADLDRLLTGKGPRQPKSDVHETLDTAVTKQLKSALTEDRFHTLIQALSKDSSDILKILKNIDKIDPESLGGQLHKFAGIAATVGAIAVRDILCRAETAAKAGDIKELEKELHAFSEAWEKTLRHLNAQDKAA